MRKLSTLLTLALLSTSAPAFAQDDTANAQEVFELGRRAAEDRRWDVAAHYFERAWEMSRESVLLYNIGVAYERANRRADALEWLERYLAAGDDLPRRAEVQERIQALRRAEEPTEEPPTAEEPEPVIEPEPVAEEEPVDSDGGANVGAIVLTGTGVALAVSGAVFLGLASAAASTVEDAAATRMAYWPEVSDDEARAQSFSVVGALLLGVGGAAALAGLVWWILGGEDEAPQSGVSITPTGATVWGRF